MARGALPRAETKGMADLVQTVPSIVTCSPTTKAGPYPLKRLLKGTCRAVLANTVCGSSSVRLSTASR